MKTDMSLRNTAIRKILTEKKSVLDIGGIRINRGNKVEKELAWAVPLVENVDYKLMDPVPDYNPDVVGDIEDMPFPDESQDAIFCSAVLEHVKNPIKGCQEMYRVLKPGGYIYVYVPFLYYYHAEKGYYGDYWRFTEDCVEWLFEGYSHVEIEKIRGAVETWIHISPLGKIGLIRRFAQLADRVFHKQSSKQVSGFSIFAVK